MIHIAEYYAIGVAAIFKSASYMHFSVRLYQQQSSRHECLHRLRLLFCVKVLFNYFVFDGQVDWLPSYVFHYFLNTATKTSSALKINSSYS